MFINPHCHIFNLQSIFTEATVDIFEDRLKHTVLKDHVQKAIIELLRDLVRKRAAPGPVRISGPSQVVGFVNMALSRSMDQEADALLRATKEAVGSDEDVVFTPLMMDVITGEPDERGLEEELFNVQFEQTRRQMYRHPGRMLPFIAVNPKRSVEVFGPKRDAISRMKDALEKQGFVGVKLYPSLGYTLENLETCGDGSFFAYLSENSVPITMHTNPEGFRAKGAYWQYCQPNKFEKYLESYPGLRINFAHFGGGKCFIPPSSNDLNTHWEWKEQIFELMRAFPGRVYADVSYHDQPWDDGWLSITKPKRQAYFRGLAEAMDDPAIGPHILFGTDFFLILMTTKEDNYVKTFRKKMGGRFKDATDANPRRFLGLADREGDMGWSMKNHLEFLRRTRPELQDLELWCQGSSPAHWLPDDLKK